MGDNLFTFMYWAMGNGLAAGEWPAPGGDLVTGGSPRYNVYRTRDGKFVAAAPLEQKFWDNFCALIGLAPEFKSDERDPAATRRAVAEKIAGKSSKEWRALFAGKDICCSIMASVEEAMRDPHFVERGVFNAKLAADGKQMTALPVPVAPQFRAQTDTAGYPALGEANSLLK
jgi:crotonobetainyl-CoA:carnitine CoA-transferase CaiB-like acyl-CoA transferase